MYLQYSGRFVRGPDFSQLHWPRVWGATPEARRSPHPIQKCSPMRFTQSSCAIAVFPPVTAMLDARYLSPAQAAPDSRPTAGTSTRQPVRSLILLIHGHGECSGLRSKSMASRCHSCSKRQPLEQDIADVTATETISTSFASNLGGSCCETG